MVNDCQPGLGARPAGAAMIAAAAPESKVRSACRSNSPRPPPTPFRSGSSAPESWPAIQTAIGAGGARFAAACGFEPKPGRLQLLPDADGGLAGVAVRPRRARTRKGSRSDRRRASSPRALPAGDLSLRQRAARAGARGAGVPARPLSLRALPRRPGARGRASSRPTASTRRGSSAIAARGRLRPRPRQHARQRPRARRARKRGRAARAKNSAPALESDRAATICSSATCRSSTPSARAGAEPPRLVDFVWGRADAPKVTLVGKGVVFDTRRPRHQAGERHGADEEGHGRRRRRARLARLIMEIAASTSACAC